MNVDMIKVESSNIIAIGWAEDTLYVQYKGGLYMYEKVPENIWEQFKAAESKGRFMNTFVKGQYNYTKINTL